MIHIENIQVGYGHCVVAEFAGDIAFAKARHPFTHNYPKNQVSKENNT